MTLILSAAGWQTLNDYLSGPGCRGRHQSISSPHWPAATRADNYYYYYFSLILAAEVVTNTNASYYIAPDANAVYFVLTASDVRNVEGFCTAFCGYHTANVFAGQILKYSFVGNAGRVGPLHLKGDG
jgi:hypothetical protein